MSRNDKYRAVFKRLERDDEFRARVGFKYVTVEYDEHVSNWYYGGTHTEKRHKRVAIDTLSGEALDDAVWTTFKMQRKIIEDVSR